MAKKTWKELEAAGVKRCVGSYSTSNSKSRRCKRRAAEGNTFCTTCDKKVKAALEVWKAAAKKT